MKWMPVESYDYYIQSKVELTYRSILQLHKVRCVNKTSGATEFLEEQCKFKNGKGEVNEGWVTKGPVEAGEWRWEVELKPGEY